MRNLIALLVLFSSLSFAVDSLRVLRIQSDVQGAWDQGEWFRNELDVSLKGFQKFRVISRADIEKMLVHAQMDPLTRNIPATQMVDSLFPANIRMDVRVNAPVHKESRTPVLFFRGRRNVRMEVSFRFWTTDSSFQELQGDMVADTTIGTGYCGILDCVVKPQPMQERLLVEKALFGKILVQLKSRLEQLIEIPAAHKAKQDSLKALQDSIKPIGDSLGKASSFVGSSSSMTPGLSSSSAAAK